MNIRTFAVLSVVLLSVCTVPVSASYGGNNNIANSEFAQTNETTAEPSSDEEVEQVRTQLSGGMDLVSYEFDSEASTVTLHFRSDYKQTVIITDAFIPAGEGAVDVNRERIDVNGEKTVTFDVTKVNGKMGVTLDAGAGLKGIVENVGFTLSAEYSAGQVFAIILISVGVGVTLVLGVAYKRKIEHTTEVEKVI